MLTGPSTILEPDNQEIGTFYVVEDRRAMDFEAPKLREGRLGWPYRILTDIIIFLRNFHSKNGLDEQKRIARTHALFLVTC